MKRKQCSTSLLTSAATIAATAFIILSSLEQSPPTAVGNREQHAQGTSSTNNNNNNYLNHRQHSILPTVNGERITPSTPTAAAASRGKTNFHASTREDNGDGMELERYHRSTPINPATNRPTNGNNEDPNDNIIIVATIDGTFYGLSKLNGEVIWESKDDKDDILNNHNDSRLQQQQKQQRTKHHRKKSSSDNQTQTDNDNNENSIFAPLITTSTTRSSTKSSWKTSAVPSIDGKVFLTLGGNGRGAGGGGNNNRDASNAARRDKNQKVNRKDLVNYAIADTTTTVNMKDLVNRSPFMDARGRFYVSSKKSYAVALDRDTGDVVKVVNGNKYGKDDTSHNDDNDSRNGRDDGYEDNRNIDQYGGDDDEINDIFKDDSTFCEENDSDEGYCERQNETEGQERNLIWMGRVDYSVTVHDARTGELDVEFSTSEVLSLEDMIGKIDASGNREPNYPDILTLPTSEDDRERFVQIDGEGNKENTNSFHGSKIVTTPGGKVALCDEREGNVLWIAEDVFKTPVAFALESSSGASLGVHVVPDAPSSNSFSKEYLSSKLEEDDIDDRSFINDNPNHAMGGTVFGALETGQLFALPLGGQSSGPNQRLLEGLPHMSLPSSIAGSRKNPIENFPRLSGNDEWRNQDSRNRNDDYAVALKNHICDPKSSSYNECLLQSYRRYQNDLVFGNYGAIPPDEIIYPPNEVNVQPAPKSKFHFLYNLMSSWIPPAIALAFVISFEIGRREKSKEESKLRRDSSDDSGDIVDEKNTLQTANRVIDVSEEVLGYGGHGTVVYRGKLEGRAVAVKRMLKAYHASADREISLLIESDGHPNVVRYFLKEVRGDFVYLALELCDMNLQDLIAVMTRNKMNTIIQQSSGNMKQATPIDKATKQLLFEIALGVKHIHSLRIVHRDLKPANILLARKHRKRKGQNNVESIFEAFQAQNFVVKISDMGLGKQLMGQSSFGMSTMNNSVGMSMSRNDASTIAGAGPGSVGWQAPEVMAHRLSPESPMLKDESSGPEAMLEASPIDASINGRTSRSVDIFSLGCIFYCTILPGSHPFGEWYEREANIMKNCPSTQSLENVAPDASDLILSMLDRRPKSRPNAKQICSHPFFWNPLKRLSFFCDLSDRLERLESKDAQTPLEYLIERNAVTVVGTGWDTKLDAGLFNNVTKFRTYDSSSVKDCLRLIRNKSHHFDELPLELKEKIAATQEDLLSYFESVFPKLLMHCFETCRDNLTAGDEFVAKYEIPVNVVKSNIESTLSPYPEKKIFSQITQTQSPTVKITRNIESNSTITEESQTQVPTPVDVVIWENSSAASTFQCRGWMRSEEEWVRGPKKVKKVDQILLRCAEDGKFRTRLCNHWDQSQGTVCPMRKKNKCDFAHGPVELRVKEGKRNRWGKLVDAKGNNSNVKASGGEDTYGAARSIEIARKEEGKWATGGKQGKKGKKKAGKN